MAPVEIDHVPVAAVKRENLLPSLVPKTSILIKLSFVNFIFNYILSINYLLMYFIYTSYSPTSHRTCIIATNNFDLLYHWLIEYIILIFLYFISYFFRWNISIIYLTSLASNEIFKPSMISLMIIILASSTRSFFLFLDPMILYHNNIIKIRSFILDFHFCKDIELINTIYNSTNINITIFIVF